VTIHELIALAHRHRFDLQDEKRTQVQIAGMLTAAGVPFEREVRLSDEDIVDFLVAGGIALEVKIKGPRMPIFRQLERYAQHNVVEAIVLFTSVSMLLPGEIGGKPAAVASLSRGWM
jgi:hypothetical protein